MCILRWCFTDEERLFLTHAAQRERPANAKRWEVHRTVQSEYIGYVTPFIKR